MFDCLKKSHEKSLGSVPRYTVEADLSQVEYTPEDSNL